MCPPLTLHAPHHPNLVNEQCLLQALEPAVALGAVTQKGTLDGPIQRPLSGQQS